VRWIVLAALSHCGAFGQGGAAAVPFPDVKDMTTLRMTLTRSMCFGTCPDYTVEVRGDGAVEFTGRRFVFVVGNQHGRISPGAVTELLAEFRRADFFSLKDSYASMATDYPTYTVGIEFDGRKKSVRDYAGRSVGMPEAVTILEQAIDRLSGAGKWIRNPAKVGTTSGPPAEKHNYIP
jgi:hypothetical protein